MSLYTGFDLKSYGYSVIPKSMTAEDRKLLSSVFHDCDSNNKGYLTREDTKIAVVSLYGYKPSKYEVNQLLDKYGESLQDDVKGRGFLTVEDLKKTFSQVAPHLPIHAVAAAFKELDRDGDGRISYRDFDFMMKYGKDS
ncbi:EF-hand calcium-binding domain-containing protein 11-like isoform X2 [Haliotis rufescens]|uniref:EF-hand calcium-binding domain-containing protein 11-like isoform X2 n=1 Tax=Haliotis rufescens TaxID=6454 RepID=UPI001EB018B0|nr:EF-hand calcium-binding domain-containing protein 11-like isoform X2 [Haliotis rufescens]